MRKDLRWAPIFLRTKFEGSSAAMYGGYRIVRAMEYWTLVNPRSFSNPATFAFPRFALSRKLHGREVRQLIEIELC